MASAISYKKIEMNILGIKQQELYSSDICAEEWTHKEQSLFDLYYCLRQKEENSPVGQLTLRQRKLLHPLIRAAIKASAILNGFRFQIISDRHTSIQRPIIFAATHQGKFDIELLSSAISTHMYLLTGDYERIQGTPNAFLLGINGVFYVNEADKKDRALVKEKMINHLQSGGNIMYYPEGNWNITESLPVHPCFWGIVEVARRGNAVIVPVAMERYDKHYEINIGENIDLNNPPFNTFDRVEAIRMLRDTLATLKWEIWERHNITHEQAIQADWDSIIDARLAEWPNFDRSCLERMLFKPKNIVIPENAFAHLEIITPSIENAFLFNKRLKGGIRNT